MGWDGMGWGGVALTTKCVVDSRGEYVVDRRVLPLLLGTVGDVGVLGRETVTVPVTLSLRPLCPLKSITCN